jgi:hypothetical protein
MFAFLQAALNMHRNRIDHRQLDSGFEGVQATQEHLQRYKIEVAAGWNRHCNLSVSQLGFSGSCFVLSAQEIIFHGFALTRHCIIRTIATSETASGIEASDQKDRAIPFQFLKSGDDQRMEIQPFIVLSDRTIELNLSELTQSYLYFIHLELIQRQGAQKQSEF